MDLLGLFLVVPFQGDFITDIILPAVAGAFVFALIINSLLNHWGYRLW
jgi:zinc transporter ZupT